MNDQINQELFKNSCWSCKKARENWKYICPKLDQHWKEYYEKF